MAHLPLDALGKRRGWLRNLQAENTASPEELEPLEWLVLLASQTVPAAEQQTFVAAAVVVVVAVVVVLAAAFVYVVVVVAAAAFAGDVDQLDGWRLNERDQCF